MCEHYGYNFTRHNLDEEWDDTPGVYIFLNDDTGEYLYVGETESFETRIVTNHERWGEALNLGMTHVLASEPINIPDLRNWAEEFIIRTERPRLNVQLNPD